MNALEKVVDVLTAVCLLFLIPLLYYQSGIVTARTVLMGEACEMFLKRVSTAGEITSGVWQELTRELAVYGCEKFELVRVRWLYEPDSTGNVQRLEYVTEKEGISTQIAAAGKEELLQGDRLWLTVYVQGVPAVYSETVRSGEAME